MRPERTAFAASLAIALVLIAGCSTPVPTAQTNAPTPRPTTAVATPEPTATTSTESPASPLATPVADSPLPTPTTAVEIVADETPMPESIWAADGFIAEAEYNQFLDFGDIRLWWTHDGTYLYLAMEGDTAGWVAVGINPQRGMQGASYLFGYVKDGEASIWDAFGTAPNGPNHPPDEDLGGTNDIVAFAGVEDGGVTRFEVQIPLDSGDAYDHRLEPGMGYPIIVAIGGEDSFNGYHLRYDRGELVLP